MIAFEFEDKEPSYVKKNFSLLSKEDKKSAAFVTLTVIIQAIMEVTGAASIVPLLIVFVNSGSALDNPLIKQLNDFTHMIGIPEGANFTFVLMSFLFVLTVLTFLVRSYSSYQRNLFVEKTRYSLGKDCLAPISVKITNIIFYKTRMNYQRICYPKLTKL